MNIEYSLVTAYSITFPNIVLTYSCKQARDLTGEFLGCKNDISQSW